MESIAMHSKFQFQHQIYLKSFIEDIARGVSSNERIKRLSSASNKLN